jgi:hypothetical protein
MKKLALTILLCLIFGATGFCQSDGVPSAPQSASPSKDPKGQSDWHITWVPGYLWLSGVDGHLGVRGRTIPISASFSDVFDKLNFGVMTALDVRKNRIGVLTDFQYLDLSSDEISTPFGKLFSSAHTDAQQYVLDPEIYGRAFESPKGFVDGFGGIRYWHLRSNLDLRPGLLPAFHASDSRDWVDPVLGARFRVNLKKGLFLMLKGDGGGFGAGSQVTWQVYGGAGKEIKQRYSLFLGYRRLSVDYRDGGFIYDTNMNGILLGLGIRLK